MFGILAVVFFALATLEHGAAITVHTHWLNVTGLTLLGLLCLALAGATTWAPWSHK